MEALLTGAEPAQIAAFLVLLRAKGETADEVHRHINHTNLVQLSLFICCITVVSLPPQPRLHTA